MSFVEFYVDSGGNDMAAGTVQNAAASVTSTNGNWSTVTNIFTPAGGGTPFSAVSAGQYASIYVDGTTTGAVYISKILTVNAGGATITLDTVIKWGTAPTTSATGRSCKVGGSHLSELPWASGGLTGTVPSSTRVNWKQATYTLTASRTFSIAGTTTAPLWFRGYNTNPGDCDSDPSLTRPTLALNATFLITASGIQQMWSSFNTTGNRSGTIFSLSSAAGGRIMRCRFENTSSNAACIAFTATSVTNVITYSWFKTPATATTTGVVSIGSNIGFYGCVAEGGGLACFNLGTSTGTYAQCITIGGVNGFLTTTGSPKVVQCTVYNPSGDGIRWNGAPDANGPVVIGSLFSNCGGAGINNASGTNSNNVFRACNDFYSCSGGNESGFGDSPAFFEQSETASPFINTSTNFGIATGAKALNDGFAPGGFEAYPLTVSYATIGAVQAAGGGVVGIIGDGSTW